MKHLSLVCICLLITLLSCEKGELNADQSSPQSINSKYVPLEAAKRAANSFLSSTQLSKANPNGRVASRTQKEVVTVNDSIGNPAFYIINYDNDQGFVIVSAERKIHPILAFNTTGSFQSYSPQSGVSLWTDNLKHMVNFIRKHPNATELKGASEKWREFDSMKSARAYGDTPCDGCEPGICPPNLLVNNFMNTTWGQESGYNGYCPLASGGYCDRALTGCVATAMMQVMRYYSAPYAFNGPIHNGAIAWSAMPNAAAFNCTLSSGADELSRMMAETGGVVNMSYGATGSSAYASLVPTKFKNVFGYSSSTDRYTYNYSSVVNELDFSRPVILDGGDHMWVTSGYYRWYSSDCTSSGLQLYMNWGWRGQNNGFYAFNDWVTVVSGVTYDFNSGKRMTLIYP